MSNRCGSSSILYTGLACGAVMLGWAIGRRFGRKREAISAPEARSILPEAALSPAHPVANAGQSNSKEMEKVTKRLYETAAALALNVFADSLMEHYRGCFSNRAMYIAPVVSAAMLTESTLAATSSSSRGAVRTGLFCAAGLTGIAGLGFHAYNIGKREGGFGWHNFFYAAPLGAPGAIALSGLFGLAAEYLQSSPGQAPKFFGLPAGRSLAALSAFGLIGNVGEVALLHFRGAFQDPVMYVPVAVPIAAAGAMTAVAVRPSEANIRISGVLLKSTGLLGVAGTAFHTYGIHRNMGGWRNWSQMILQGPPLPAPPSFTGLALAGLGALSLLSQRENNQ